MFQKKGPDLLFFRFFLAFPHRHYETITKAYTTIAYGYLVEAVENLLPVAPIIDYVGFPQYAQVSAYRRLGQTDLSGDIADRHFPRCK